MKMSTIVCQQRKTVQVTGINVRTVIISLTLLSTVRQHGLITQLQAVISTVQYVATLRQALKLTQLLLMYQLQPHVQKPELGLITAQKGADVVILKEFQRQDIKGTEFGFMTITAHPALSALIIKTALCAGQR